MPVTLDQLAAMDAAIATGERAIRSPNGTVEYRSIDELIRARNALQSQYQAEQAAVSGRPLRRRVFRMFHAGRGFD
jgi:hypothetical protein